MTTDIEQLCNELQHHLDSCRLEVVALKSGKKSSAPRARKSLQSIKTISHKLRGDIVSHVKALPTKSRVKKQPEERPEECLRSSILQSSDLQKEEKEEPKSLDSDEEVPESLQPPKLERQTADQVKEEAVEKSSTKKATKKRVVKKKA